MNSREPVRAPLAPYPVEVAFPDIRRWEAGNTGVAYVHTFDSGAAGPHVMVMALTHGNEVSGAIAVDALLAAGVRPRIGRITLGFANVAAYFRFDARQPDANRFVDEDLNRVWAEARLDGPGDSVELRRARALRPILDDVDYLLDLHSMHEAGAPLMLSGILEKGIRFAEAIGVPRTVIVDAGHANGKRMRDYGGFGDADSPKNALLLESGQHFSARSRAVALDAAARFLLELTQAASDTADLRGFLLPEPPAAQRMLKVCEAVVADSMDFRFTQPLGDLQRIARAGTVIARDGEREIVTPFDDCVAIMPSLRQLAPGVTVVRLAREIARA
ncbi:succinylglutamate desuccinylase/aspartoacylase domain-containing protein [Burkholderia sp. Ac-20379]|uniref:succinylglutamate desuccinylase/aspartoacylase domain-containing protein n=1 Tax=Burkholderia sp. Ac-20379 TaxID=2703900 RepID=UPI001981D519|nr:succinylglutamate desuccinylase/aspartoacylase family protein [Burkholderia sp. Ac-20379]MBN3727984.1 succinylglutamate desuccinylase [Burkholderia sp. Ac-20379]